VAADSGSAVGAASGTTAAAKLGGAVLSAIATGADEGGAIGAAEDATGASEGLQIQATEKCEGI
jgi:hypothetical protein